MKRVVLTQTRRTALKRADANRRIFDEIATGKSRLMQLQTAPLLTVLRPEGGELVVVAVVGSNLKAGSLEIMQYARLQRFNTIRFHTTLPELLLKSLAHVPVIKIEHRRRLFGPDEHIFRVKL